MKSHKKENTPSYKKELAIYEKETADKIEVFRLARRNWLANVGDSEDAFAKVKEGVQESNTYEGRSFILRKIRMKTTLLRNHHKTVRPLRYWTFKRKIPEIDMYEETQIKKVKNLIKREELQGSCSSDRLWTKAAIKECEREAAKIRGTRERRQAEKECKRIRPSGPCVKAIKRLKESKRKEGLVESCKCEDGREVTVVIKGICLCDKYGLNNLDLHKVCDEYSRMVKASRSTTTPHKQHVDKSAGDTEKQAKEATDKQETEETQKLENTNELDDEKELNELNFVDSMEVINRKKSFLGSDLDFDERIIRKTFDTNSESKKALKFENEEFLKRDGGRKVSTESEITLYRKLSSREIMDDTDAEAETNRESSLQEKQKEEKADETQNLSPKRSDNLQSHVKNYVKAMAEKNKSPTVEPLSMTNLLPEEEEKNGENLKLEKSKLEKNKKPGNIANSISREIIYRRLLNSEALQESIKPSESPQPEPQKKAPPIKDGNKHVTVTPEIRKRNAPKKEIHAEHVPNSISKEIINSGHFKTEQEEEEELKKSSKGQQSLSLNNLLPDAEESTSVILKPKSDKYGPHENKSPGKSVLKPVSKEGIIKASNSLEFHKQKLERKSYLKSEEEVDVKVDENRNPDEKKVALDNTPTVIPHTYHIGENSSREKPQAEAGARIFSARGKLEYPEEQTTRNSVDKNIDKEMETKIIGTGRRKSYSRSLLSTKESKLENEPDGDMSSMVTLYKNTSAVESEMGLTNEEREKMEEMANSPKEITNDDEIIK